MISVAIKSCIGCCTNLFAQFAWESHLFGVIGRSISSSFGQRAPSLLSTAMAIVLHGGGIRSVPLEETTLTKLRDMLLDLKNLPAAVSELSSINTAIIQLDDAIRRGAAAPAPKKVEGGIGNAGLTALLIRLEKKQIIQPIPEAKSKWAVSMTETSQLSLTQALSRLPSPSLFPSSSGNLPQLTGPPAEAGTIMLSSGPQHAVSVGGGQLANQDLEKVAGLVIKGLIPGLNSFATNMMTSMDEKLRQIMQNTSAQRAQITELEKTADNMRLSLVDEQQVRAAAEIRDKELSTNKLGSEKEDSMALCLAKEYKDVETVDASQHQLLLQELSFQLKQQNDLIKRLQAFILLKGRCGDLAHLTKACTPPLPAPPLQQGRVLQVLGSGGILKHAFASYRGKHTYSRCPYAYVPQSQFSCSPPYHCIFAYIRSSSKQLSLKVNGSARPAQTTSIFILFAQAICVF